MENNSSFRSAGTVMAALTIVSLLPISQQVTRSGLEIWRPQFAIMETSGTAIGCELQTLRLLRDALNDYLGCYPAKIVDPKEYTLMV